MININLKTISDGPDVHVFVDFDHIHLVKKSFRKRLTPEENSYTTAIKVREAVRDFLFYNRKEFGKVERRMETILFRLSGS